MDKDQIRLVFPSTVANVPRESEFTDQRKGIPEWFSPVSFAKA